MQKKNRYSIGSLNSSQKKQSQQPAGPSSTQIDLQDSPPFKGSYEERKKLISSKAQQLASQHHHLQ